MLRAKGCSLDGGNVSFMEGFRKLSEFGGVMSGFTTKENRKALKQAILVGIE